MNKAPMTHRMLLLATVLATLAGCRRAADSAPAVPAVAPPAVPAVAPAPPPVAPAPPPAPPAQDDSGLSAAALTGDLAVRSVYPASAGPDPRATRVCGLLYDRPAARRAECCGRKPNAGLAAECVRNLTGALAAGAVRLDDAAVARCDAALASALSGCDWVEVFPVLPPAPPECGGLVSGTVVAGATCRSSLECGDGMRCAGAGPTEPGICAAPQPAGASCGATVDVLMTYLREDNVKHPDCLGFCDGHRCVDQAAAGQPCKSNVACGPGKGCVEHACQAGVPGKAGQPCFAGQCEPGLECQAEGTCAAPLAEGASCASASECRGACVRKIPGDATGTCSAQCLTRPTSALRLPAGVVPPPRHIH